jgi:hypothetical protein
MTPVMAAESRATLAAKELEAGGLGVVSEGTKGGEQRRHPRVPLRGGEIQARIHNVAAAPVVNLSAAGALLEVPSVLKPHSTHVLHLSAAGCRDFEAKVIVVRSYVHGFGRNERGGHVIKYRAAVAFVDLNASQRAGLEELMVHALRASSGPGS